MSDHIEYKIQVADDSLKEILIARLSAAGANGFEEERSLLKTFIDEDYNDGVEFEKIIEDNGLSYSKAIIRATNWNAIWEADFRPVTIGNFCVIRADFHDASSHVKHDIVITPKMSFGTGHHATTVLMITAMETLDFTGKDVFDFGTGTGILSVLAEKCGARKISAVDNDAWSIENATDNFNVNNCRNIMLLNSDGFEPDATYNIILANINRNVILAQLQQIKQHLADRGVVLLSGLLTGDEQVIVAEAARNQLKLAQKSEMSGWISLLMVNA